MNDKARSRGLFGYAQAPQGQLHYRDAGSGDPILLLHQTPRSLDEFAELQPLLARNHRVIAMDMVGFGGSDCFGYRFHGQRDNQDCING